jgi:hypothetical protein
MGPQGTSFVLTGTGFAPGEQVAITVAPGMSSPPGVSAADGNGILRVTLRVGGGDPTGGYSASVQGLTSGGRATAGFTVTAQPTVQARPATALVFPGSGPQGATFTVTGSGFAPNEPVASTIVYPGGSLQGTLGADASGAVQGSIGTDTGDPTGAYVVTLVGRASGSQATASFNVTAAQVAVAEPTATPRPTLAPLPTTPPEPYAVFIGAGEVMLGQRSVIENMITCQLPKWGNDCSKRVRDVTTLQQVLGPFNSSSEARTALCAAYVPNSWRVAPLAAGTRAKFSFAPDEVWTNNISPC